MQINAQLGCKRTRSFQELVVFGIGNPLQQFFAAAYQNIGHFRRLNELRAILCRCPDQAFRSIGVVRNRLAAAQLNACCRE